MSVLEPSTVERYEDLPAAQSNASGAVTLTPRSIPQGTRIVATISIPGASALSQWTIARGNPALGPSQVLMTWAGPTPVGPFTLDGPDQLIIAGTGVTASSSVQAVVLGKQGPAALIVPEVPTGPPQFLVPSGGPPTVLDTWTANTGVIHIISNLPSGLRAVTIAIAGGPAQQIPLIVTGATATTPNVFRLYFNGELPLTGPTFQPAMFAIDPDIVTLQITQSGAAPVTLLALGSFTDRAFWLQPPGGMPPSASQLTSQSGVAPGLDRALWTARADCPRKMAEVTLSAAGAANNLVAAPGAGLRLKVYSITCQTGAATAGNGIVTGTVGGGTDNLARVGTTAATGTQTSRDLNGLEMDANTGLTLVWSAGTVVANVAYDIVPA